MLFQESKNRATIALNQTSSSVSSLHQYPQPSDEGYSDYLFKSAARKDAFRLTPGYKSYISNLVSTGYFRNEIEGSKLWNDLEVKASEVYVEAVRERYAVFVSTPSTTDAFEPSESLRPSFAMIFNSALARAPEMLLDPDGPEDSDEWMKLDASSFDEVLTRSFEKDQNTMDLDSEAGEENRFVSEQSDKLHDLAAKIEQFVQGEGDLEGARFEE